MTFFLIFPIVNFLKISQLTIVQIFQIAHFRNFSNCKLSEFSKLENFQIANCFNFRNWKFFKFSELKNRRISEKNS